MKILLALAGLLLASATGAAPPGATYTLYRSSALDPAMRLHIATFDAAESGSYNQENCAQALALFQAQPGVKAKFWCEAGTFKKSPAN